MRSILTDLVLPDKVLCHCFSYISILVIKQHDQGHLEEEVFNWIYSFSELECVIVEQRCGGRSVWEFTSWSTSRKQRRYTTDGASFLKSQRYPSDTLPAVPYFPIFPKELHQLGQSIQTYFVGAILIQTATNSLPSDFIHCQFFTTRRQWKAEH